MYVNRCRNFRRQKCDKKRSGEDSKTYNLTTEILCMWSVKTKVIPVRIGATGTILKSFRKYLSNWKNEIKGKESP
jgi:hypothetical protein